MATSKTIKIFLASSITELHDERLYLCDYIMKSVRPLIKNDNVEVELFKCEDIHTGNNGRSAQDEIDDILKESDISVFLFKKKAGPDTIHEFKMARELQKTKHHEIYVYVQDIPDDERSDELRKFLSKLERQKKNRLYWKIFKDVDSIEKQFVIGLLQYERHLLGIKIAPDIEQESVVEKDGDARFAKFESNEKDYLQKQAPLREMLHQDIEKLLLQAKSVMEDESDTIAARIFETKKQYEKADLWASKTDYDREKYADLLFNYAQFLYRYGLYRDSEAVYLRQIPLAAELYGTEHENIAASYNDIGVVYLDQGDYPKALDYHFKALEIFEKALGKDHPNTASSYNNIGGVFDDQGNYTKALEYYFKALEIREKVLGTEHSDTAQSYNNIGVVYWEQGDYPKALEYYFKALEIDEKVLGKDHPGTATDYNNIGKVYDDQGDYPKALEYNFKALEIKEKVLGKDHPATATSYNNIGSLYYHQGDYPKALEYLNKALEIRKKKLGPNQPNTKNTQEWIDLVHEAMGESHTNLLSSKD